MAFVLGADPDHGDGDEGFDDIDVSEDLPFLIT